MMAHDELRIARVQIQDARRIKSAEIKIPAPTPGKGMLIEFLAANDQGKTTLHDTLAAFFEPGKHPDLIREGCDKAVSVMELSNGVQIIRTHEPNESTYDVIGANGVEISAPATYIKKLAKGFAFDPIAFDEADPKDQIKYLLEISDVTFTPDELCGALGDVAWHLLADRPLETINLAYFGRFLKSITDLRAATGRKRDEKASTVESLRKTLLEADCGEEPKNWQAELKAATAERDGIDSQLRIDSKRILSVHEPKREAVRKDIAARKDELRRQMEELTREESRRLGTIDLEERAEEQTAECTAADARIKNQARVTTAQNALQSQAAFAGNRDLMNKTSAAIEKLNAEYDALQNGATALDTLRKSKVESGLLRGLEIDPTGQQILIDGIRWHAQNQATRFMKAMEIVANGIGDLDFATVDKGESLDAASKAAFRKAVEASGRVVLLFRVMTPEELEKYGPAMRTIPEGVIDLKLAAKPRKR